MSWGAYYNRNRLLEICDDYFSLKFMFHGIKSVERIWTGSLARLREVVFSRVPSTLPTEIVASRTRSDLQKAPGMVKG